jgi:hypothetical protein
MQGRLKSSSMLIRKLQKWRTVMSPSDNSPVGVLIRFESSKGFCPGDGGSDKGRLSLHFCAQFNIECSAYSTSSFSHRLEIVPKYRDLPVTNTPSNCFFLRVRDMERLQGDIGKMPPIPKQRRAIFKFVMVAIAAISFDSVFISSRSRANPPPRFSTALYLRRYLWLLALIASL